jgi:hypothetical protein
MAVTRVLACALLFAAVSLSNGCKSACHETVTEALMSPDQTNTAKVAIVNCGATSRYFTYVGLGTVADPNGGVFATYGTPLVQVVWKDTQTLQVLCADCNSKDTYKKLHNHGHYRIIYGPTSDNPAGDSQTQRD